VQCVAFCDEHGKLDNLPTNVRATELWKAALIRADSHRLDDVLCGPVAVVYGDAEFMAAL